MSRSCHRLSSVMIMTPWRLLLRPVFVITWTAGKPETVDTINSYLKPDMAERDMKQSTGPLALGIWKNSKGLWGSGTGSSSLTTFICKVNYFCVNQSSQYLGYNNSLPHYTWPFRFLFTAVLLPDWIHKKKNCFVCTIFNMNMKRVVMYTYVI